jgi:hypothetical protein
MLPCASRQIDLVQAGGNLAGLHQFVDEAIDRPRVDELPVMLGVVADLGVTLGDLDDRDVEIARQYRPVLARCGSRAAVSQHTIEIEQGALDEVRHQPRIRAVVDDGRWRIRAEFRGESQCLFANHEIGPVAHRQHRVRVDPGPRLDGGVEVQGLLPGAEANQVEARDVDRKVQDKVAGFDVFPENATMIRWGQMCVLVVRTAILGQPPSQLVGRQHPQAPFSFERDVAPDDWEDALPDAAGPDDDDPARELHSCHEGPLSGFMRRRCTVRRTVRATPARAPSMAALCAASRLSNTTLGKARRTTLIRHD